MCGLLVNILLSPPLPPITILNISSPLVRRRTGLAWGRRVAGWTPPSLERGAATTQWGRSPPWRNWRPPWWRRELRRTSGCRALRWLGTQQLRKKIQISDSLLPFDDITPMGFLAFFRSVTLKSWGMSLAAGGLYSQVFLVRSSPVFMSCLISSLVNSPRPMMKAPSTWPMSTTGEVERPASSSRSVLTTNICPVRMSTSTSVIPAPHTL